MTDSRPVDDSTDPVTTLASGDPLAAFLVRDGRIVAASDAFATVFGDAPDGSFYRRLAAAVDEGGDAARRAADDDEAVSGGVVTLGDGDRYYRHDAVPVGDARLELFQDVTGLVEWYRQFDLFETLVERAQDGLYATDGDGRITYCNGSFADALGRDPDDLVGHEATALVAEPDREAARRLFDAVDGAETGDDIRTLRHDGADSETVPLEVHVAARDRGAGVVAVARDVTDRRRRERRLEQYRTLVENADDPMLALDDDDRVEVCNGAMASFLGRDGEDLTGAAATDLLPAGAVERIRAALASVRWDDDRGFERVCLTLDNAAGESRRLEATVAPISEGEDVRGYVCTFRDVTERERQTRDLELLKRLLVGVVRADVPETVAEIRDRATELETRLSGREADLAATIRERCGAIEDVAAKSATAERIVDEDPTVAPRNLQRVVRRSVDAVHDPESAVTVEVDVPDVSVAAVSAVDAAVENLVENAVEHGSTNSRSQTPEDAVEHGSASPDSQARRDAGSEASEPSVPDAPEDSAKRSPSGSRPQADDAPERGGDAPTVRVTAEADAETVRLTVADDGPGIDEGELDVLERGAETPLEHGSGVGLRLVDWIVDKSGGDLVVDTDDDGTAVHVTLDRAEASPPTDDHAVSDGGADDAPGSGDETPAGSDRRDTPRRSRDAGRDDPDVLRILCVDPGADTPSTIRAAAAEADHSVTVEGVTAADVAVERLRESGIDCLVTDRFSPDALSTLLDAAATAGVPTILYTSADHTDLGEGVLTTVDSLVEKYGEGSASLLLQKVLAVVGDGDGETERRGPAARAVAALGDPAVAVHRDGQRRVVDAPPGVDASSGDDLPSAEDRTPAVVDDGRALDATVALDDTVGRVDAVTVGRDGATLTDDHRRLSLLETLAGRARDGLSVVDANGVVEYHNPSFGSLLGYENMVGTHAASFMAEGELRKGQLAIQRVLATPTLESELLDMEFVTADGDRITLAVNGAVRLLNGEYAGMINVARDVTERKVRERRLDQYRALVEHAGDPMVLLDDEARIELCNESLADLFGRSPEDLRGDDVATHLTRGAVESGLAAIDRLRETGRTAVSFEQYLDADGRRHEVTVCAVETDGRVSGTVWTCRDVTERTRRENELDLLKQVLGRVLRHNLRNELTLVSGHAELLADATEGEAEQLTTEIVRWSDRLSATAENARAVEAILDYRVDLQRQDLERVVGTATADTPSHLAADYDIPSSVPVLAHRSLPRALANACRWVAAPVTTDDPHVEVTADVEGDRAVVRIRSTDGRDPDTLETVTAGSETVLDRERDAGLWVLARVIELSDADVTVAADDGAVVLTVELPLAGVA